MDYSEVRKLVKLVEASQIQELELEREGTRIRVNKGTGEVVVQNLAQPAAQPMAMMPAAAPAAPQAAPAPAAPEAPAAAPAPEKTYHQVKSPMVGTFYAAPAPDAAPYVKPGDRVNAGQTVCIIEAMKLMNEIECDVAGTIVSIDVENAQPVEYGQVLLQIDTQG